MIFGHFCTEYSFKIFGAFTVQGSVQKCETTNSIFTYRSLQQQDFIKTEIELGEITDRRAFEVSSN